MKLDAGELGRALRIILGRVAAIVLLSFAGYLSLANALLFSGLVQRFASPSEDMNLKYDAAWTWWPGRIELRNLVLRFQDYNVQFELEIPRGEVDVALHELLFRRFHALRVRSEQTRFWFRHKVHEVGADAARIAAYPRIPGFAHPPLYTGPPPAPISEAEYELWEIELDDVVASIEELWFMEYRYRGNGIARGEFLLRPARFLTVLPSRLELTAGTLTVAEKAVANDVNLAISCSVEGHDINEYEGLDILEKVSAEVYGKLEGQLDFTDVYLARHGLRVRGNADWVLDARLQHGRLVPGSRLDLETREFVVDSGTFWTSGRLDASLTVPKRQNVIELQLNAPKLSAHYPNQKTGTAPTARNARLELELESSDLRRGLRPGTWRLTLPSLAVPSLGWFNHFVESDLQFAGGALAEMSLQGDGSGGSSGSLSVELERARFGNESFAVSADGKLSSEINGESKGGPLTFSDVSANLDSVELAAEGTRSPAFPLELRSEALVLTRSPAELKGTVSLSARNSDALLALWIEPKWVRVLADQALGLDALTGKLELNLSEARKRIELSRARSGGLEARGYFAAHGDRARGRLLLSTSVVNVGVRLEDGETDVAPFVSDAWLSGESLNPRGRSPTAKEK